MTERKWRLEQKLSFIFIQIHSVENSKLIQKCYHLLAIILYLTKET